MNKIKTFITIATLTLAAQILAEGAPAPNRQFLRLKCGASVEFPHQPCGGFNSTQMTINLDGVKGAYQEFSSYGGCYRVSGTNFGSIKHASQVDHLITFNFIREGDMRNGMPYVDEFKFESTAELNLKTGTMKISHHDDQEFYMRPIVLKCVKR